MTGAMLTKFIDFQSLFQLFFIFTRKIIDLLTISALELNHVILRHILTILVVHKSTIPLTVEVGRVYNKTGNPSRYEYVYKIGLN